MAEFECWRRGRKGAQGGEIEITESNEFIGEFMLYQTEDGRTRTACRFEDETIWLAQALMAELFQVTVPTVNEHLKGIYEDGEQHLEATIRKF